MSVRQTKQDFNAVIDSGTVTRVAAQKRRFTTYSVLQSFQQQTTGATLKHLTLCVN